VILLDINLAEQQIYPEKIGVPVNIEQNHADLNSSVNQNNTFQQEGGKLPAMKVERQSSHQQPYQPPPIEANYHAQ